MQSYRLPFWSRWRQGNGGPPASIANGSGHMFPESNGTSRESGTPLFASLADFEEIYLGALVPDAKRGYSILKIAEMLQSGFIRSLSADVKRNSVLMALEAAGFSLEEVLQDAGARQRALCAYESMQQKRLMKLRRKRPRRLSKYKRSSNTSTPSTPLVSKPAGTKSHACRNGSKPGRRRRRPKPSASPTPSRSAWRKAETWKWLLP